MGRIVSNFFISLDGVVEAPDQWHVDFWSDDMGAVMGRSLETCSAFLMGRRLYDDWSAYFRATTRTSAPSSTPCRSTS